MVERVVRGVAQVGPVDGDDLEQIAQRHHAVDFEHFVGLVQAELGGQHPPVDRVHVLFDL